LHKKSAALRLRSIQPVMCSSTVQVFIMATGRKCSRNRNSHCTAHRPIYCKKSSSNS